MRENDDRKACWQVILIGVALFIVALIPRALNLGLFLVPDEPHWMNRSIDFLRAILERDWGATSHAVAPGMTPGGVPTKWAGSVGILGRYLIHLLKGSPDDIASSSGLDLETFLTWLEARPQNLLDILVAVRLPIAVLTALSVVGVYILARRLFDDRVALLGSLLLALDPFYLAHSRVLHTDALVTVFMSLSVLSFLVHLKGWEKERPPSPPWLDGWLLFSALNAGLAVSTKIGAIVLVPLVGFWVLAACLLKCRGQGRMDLSWVSHLAWSLFVWGVMAVLAFVLVWPAMWVDPLRTLQLMLARSEHLVEAGHPQYLLGRASTDPGLLFYPMVFLLRTTPLIGVGMVAALLQQIRNGSDGARRRPVLACLLAYAILLGWFISLSSKKQDRYLLPVFPVASLLAAVGLTWLAGLAYERLSSGRAIVWLRKKGHLVLPMCLLLQAGLAFPYYPYYLTYYNPLLGGGRVAPQLIQVGWGEGLDEVARYFNDGGHAPDLKVSAWYQEEILSYLLPGRCRPISRQSVFWDEVNYVVLYINQVQRSSLLGPELIDFFRSLEPEHTVRLNGIDYAWIYRVPRPLPLSFPFARYPQRIALGSEILFLGYDLYDKWHEPDTVRLNLYWSALQEMESDYTVYLKLINGAYHLWGQQEGRPRWGGFPTNRWSIGQVVGDKREIEILPGTPPGFYQVVVDLYDPYRQRSLEPADGQELLLGPVEIPRGEPPPVEALDIEHPLEIDLGGKARLLGYNIESGFRPGDGIHLTLFWQALAKMDEDYTVFTHLVDSQARIWGQKDNEPVDGFYPTTEWKEGEILRDQYDLLISSKAPPGNYQLEVGMYQRATGQRLAVSDAAGSLARDKVLLSPPVVIE